jgi:uncharacterized protein YukE
MFRVAKKKVKKPARVVVNRDENEASSDEGETTVIQSVTKKKKKIKQRSVIRSFEADEDADKNEKKKKRKLGLGFGGVSPQVDDEDHEDNHHTVSMYDKDTLAKLKAEQKYRAKQENNEPAKASVDTTPTKTEEQPDITENSEALPAFVPLKDSSGEHVVLTGDEALKFDDEANESAAEQFRRAVFDYQDTPTEWEAEVTRRAGLEPNPRQPKAATSSIAELHEQLATTLSHLQAQQGDLQQAFNRRQVEVNQTKEELDRQEDEVTQSGKALEYYQELRLELASWAGALRDLKKRLMPLQDAFRDLEKEHFERWTDMENDVVNVLREADSLQQVLGRQPPPIAEATFCVDEFGRDVKSQYIMQREKRSMRWKQIRSERVVKGDESDAMVSVSEKGELLERRKALEEALQLAIDEVDEYYTSLANLTAVFTKWSNTYQEEYRQCFAGMSLADLASILVQVDLCSTHHPLHWNGDSAELPWAKPLQSLSNDGNIEETPLYRMVDKVLIPVIDELLEGKAYSLLSIGQSRSLSSFISQINSLLPQGNILMDKLTSRAVEYIQDGLQGIAIPIVKPGMKPTSEDLEEAFSYATNGQIRRIQKILINVLMFWSPVLGEKLAEAVLDFVSSQFLFLLSFLKAQGLDDVCSVTFSHIWKALQPTQWMEKPEYFLQAAPIRAAATVYQLTS